MEGGGEGQAKPACRIAWNSPPCSRRALGWEPCLAGGSGQAGRQPLKPQVPTRGSGSLLRSHWQPMGWMGKVGKGRGHRRWAERVFVLPSRLMVQASGYLHQIGPTDEPAMEEIWGIRLARLEKLHLTGSPLSWLLKSPCLCSKRMVTNALCTQPSTLLLPTGGWFLPTALFGVKKKKSYQCGPPPTHPSRQ